MSLKLHISVIPGGCTRSIQPADVSWKKPFKAKFQQLYDQLMLDGVHETTPAGNPKPPPPELYLEWVLKAWYDGVPKDNVINSFKG
ncbi:pogo transposable element with KRAB domain-like protein [Aphelenchoides avenae]|nr:pogo transposable element with KRAB domain-like protein [Aphelenchus avenae]